MRLWHKDLIRYLPRQQLLAQWKECCCICRNLAINRTPNHILVNKILDYSKEHFDLYSKLVMNELLRRGYKISKSALIKYTNNYKSWQHIHSTIPTTKQLYAKWHNKRYLQQCLANLQEKYDCGGIPKEEWKIIEQKFY